MHRNLLDILTGKLLSKCRIYQNNIYGSDGCLIYWDTAHPYHPFYYLFMKSTFIGKWLERRWVKRAHKRITIKMNEESIEIFKRYKQRRRNGEKYI